MVDNKDNRMFLSRNYLSDRKDFSGLKTLSSNVGKLNHLKIRGNESVGPED